MAQVDRRDLYDPAVSTLLFRIYYVAHILLLLVCYLVLVPAATGAFDSALVSLGLRPALPHRIAAATGAAEARGTQEGRACTPLRRRCWWPRHPAVVCGVTFLLATVAVQLQAFGQPQVATLLMPASLLGWAVSASPLTRGVGHPHTRRRALAVFLSITAAGGGTLGAILPRLHSRQPHTGPARTHTSPTQLQPRAASSAWRGTLATTRWPKSG